MKPWKEYGRYGSVGIELILSIGIGYYAGHWLDTKFGTRWIVVVGSLLGTYAGFRALFVTANKMQKDVERAEHQEKQEAERERRTDDDQDP